MIKLKNLLAESKAKLSFAVADVNFTITSKDNTIILIPDSKGLDSIELIKSKLGSGANMDFMDLVIIRLEKKTGLTFKSNLRYPGAGYAFELDMDSVIKKIQ
jgi:hypothetical protein